MPVASVSDLTMPVAFVSAAIATALKPFMYRLDRLEDATQTATSAPGTSTVHSSSVSCTMLHDDGPVKIWASAPQSVIDKIVTHQFVDLQQLLPPTATNVPSPHALVLGEEAPGKFMLSSQPRMSRRISDIEHWLEAWTIFAAVYLDANPGRAVELLAYQHYVLNASKKFTFSLHIYWHTQRHRQQ